MKLAAVIFDLDGTLIDSMGVWYQVDQEFLSKRGIPVPSDLFADMPAGNSYEETALYFKNKFNLPETTTQIMDEWTAGVAYHYQNNIKLKPGAIKLLNWLKERKIPLAVGTSNSPQLAQTVLAANNAEHYFGQVVCGDTTIKGKPHPDIFLEAARRLGATPNQCLVLEDVPVGVQAAINAGMRVYAVQDTHAPNPEWLKDNAHYFAPNLQLALTRLQADYFGGAHD